MESISNPAREAARARLAAAEAKREDILLYHIANGVNIESRTVEIDEGVVIAPGATILSGTILRGKTVIGAGCVIGPTASRYTLSEVRQLDLDAYAFQRQARTTPVEDILNVHLGLHQVVEVFDGVQSVILYKTLDGFIPAPTFDAERARQNRREQKKATA